MATTHQTVVERFLSIRKARGLKLGQNLNKNSEQASEFLRAHPAGPAFEKGLRELVASGNGSEGLFYSIAVASDYEESVVRELLRYAEDPAIWIASAKHYINQGYMGDGDLCEDLCDAGKLPHELEQKMIQLWRSQFGEQDLEDQYDEYA